jgi:hypothetical protein
MDRERERQIVIQGRAQGKSDDFIKQAVLRDRERRQQQAPSTGPVGNPLAAVRGAVSGVKTAYNARVANAEQDATAAIEGKKSLPRATYGMIAQGAGLVGDIGFEALKLATPKFVEDAVSKGTVKVAQTETARKAYSGYEDWKTKNPKTAETVGDTLNIASIIPVAAGARVAANATGKAAKTVERLGRTAVNEARLAKIASDEVKVAEAVGKIIQGKPKDIPTAMRALSSVDTTGVKTYSQLNEVLENRTEALMRAQDDYLEKIPGTLKPVDVTKTTQVGKDVVSQNFVADSLAQLDEMYGAIKDPTSQARIRNLQAKFDAEGLNRKEINDLAREYGTEFGRKAFAKNGDPLTSINGQAYENTRKGLKTSVRDSVEGNVPKTLDGQITDLIRVKDLTRKMEQKVNALQQRVQKRSLPERFARKTADVVDVLTMHTLSGFISRMLPSNVGLKTLNSLDLENQLSKNLKLIDEVLDAPNDAEMLRLINQSKASTSAVPMPTAYNAKSQGNIIPSAKAPASAINTPTVLPKNDISTSNTQTALPAKGGAVDNLTTPKDMYAMVAGIRVDEEGNITFNPLSASVGMAVSGGLKRQLSAHKNLGPIKTTQEYNELGRSMKRLQTLVSNTKNKTTLSQLQDMMNAIKMRMNEWNK